MLTVVVAAAVAVASRCWQSDALWESAGIGQRGIIPWVVGKLVEWAGSPTADRDDDDDDAFLSRATDSPCIYIYIYTHIYTYIYLYIYIWVTTGDFASRGSVASDPAEFEGDPGRIVRAYIRGWERRNRGGRTRSVEERQISQREIEPREIERQRERERERERESKRDSTTRVGKREKEKCPRCPTMPHQGTTELLKLSACKKKKKVVYAQGHAAGPRRLSRAPDRRKTTMPLPCSRHVRSGGPWEREDPRPHARVRKFSVHAET